MDDAPDKLRRNVVTISAVIIFTWFIEIEPLSLPYFGHMSQNVDKGKFWIAILVLLLYLFLRYRFDNKVQEEWRALHSELYTKRYSKLCKALSKEFRVYLLTGKKASCLINPQEYEYPRVEADEARITDVSVTASPRATESKSHQGTVNFSTTIKWGKHGSTSTSGNSIGYIETLIVRFKLNMAVWLHVMIYSKGGVDAIAPVILWYFALLITTNRIASHYF